MKIWDMDTVEDMRALVHRTRVSGPVARGMFGDYRGFLRLESARALIVAARDRFGVNPHEDDFLLKRVGEEDEETLEVTYEARWRPQTLDAQAWLDGGPANGHLVHRPHVSPSDRLQVAVLPAVVNPQRDPGPDLDLTDIHFTYQLAGWAESERFWVYR